MLNKAQEALKRIVFDVEQSLRTVTSCIKVNRTNSADYDGIGVELIADRAGWELFVNALIDTGKLKVDTRRWNPFNDDLYMYDLYVEAS